MSRKSIFQLVEENYNIQHEISKINEMSNDECYWEDERYTYSLIELVEEYLFDGWTYRGTCLTVEEFFTRVNANISDGGNTSEEVIINHLEVLENFIKLYISKSKELQYKNNIRCDPKFISVFYKLIQTLEKRMGLTTREYKDRIVIYPKNAPLEHVIDLCEDEDVQWELIRYVREDLSLSEKRKSLAYLATNLYIEEDKAEQDERIKDLVKQAGNILNNLHIRHNNKTGKWENQVLKDLDEADAISLCDMVYNEMLTIVLLREHKEYEKTYAEFNQKQKAAKAQKSTEVTQNG